MQQSTFSILHPNYKQTIVNTGESGCGDTLIYFYDSSSDRRKLGKSLVQQKLGIARGDAIQHFQLTSARSKVPLVQRTMERMVKTIFRIANWKEPSLSRKRERLESEQRKLFYSSC